MRRNGGDVEGADAEEVKGHGGRYSAARVQTLLEQNADAVYGAAAFFVTLAVLILALTPTAIEVDAGGNPVRATHLKLNLPSAFRVKLSKIAHSVKDTLSHVDWTPRSELGVGMESGLASAGVGIGAGGGAPGNTGAVGGVGVAGGGGEALSSDIIQENRALRTEVTELQGTVARLQASLQTTACLSITAAREGLCLPPLQASSAAAARASTRDKAVLRPAGYRREHKRWSAAKDHWATQYVNFKSPKRRIGFEINTHNPDTEDIYISRAVHRREIWDKPVFNVLKHVLVSKGLPPGRVLDVGGNIGYFTMWALAMGHKVTTFEPMDFNVRYIVTSIDANKFGANHTLYQNAVGNQAGRLALQPTNKQNRGNFQVQMVNGAAGELHGEYGLDYVDTVRLDDLVDEDVHLIKIDVEGFEHKVLDGARKLVCSRLVRYIEFEFTTAKSDGDCHAEQVLCWFATIGYRITSVDAVEHVQSSAEAADLNVHDWANFPSELLLTLKDSLLPPGLLLELSGTWNNPCRPLIPSRDDPHWEPYKERWCAGKLAAYSASFVPCNVWGAMPADQRRVYTAIGCDTRLGFDCSDMKLDRAKLEALTARYPYTPADMPDASGGTGGGGGGGGGGGWLQEWLSSYGNYYKYTDVY